jgi:cytochrome c oxidase subunit III
MTTLSSAQYSLNEKNNLLKHESEKIKSSIAMSVLLVSLTMLFATLVLAFVVFRLSSEFWPPMGMERPSLFYPVLSTVLILLSSITFEFYQTALKKTDTASARLCLLLTLVLGFSFLGTQTLLWQTLAQEGYLIDTGVFASMLHSFTWIHAAHIVCGLLWLLYLIPTLKADRLFMNYEIRITSAGKFWHFLGIAWVLLFVVLFVL